MKSIIDVRLRNHTFKVSTKEIEKIAKSIPSNKGRKYVTVVGGKIFSPKDLVAHLIEAKNIPLTKMDFTTMDAVRILTRLGYTTKSVGKRNVRKKTLTAYSGVLSLGGDSLRESEAWYE